MLELVFSGFAKYLVLQHLLSKEKVQHLLMRAKGQNLSFVTCLIASNLLDTRAAAQAIAKYFNLQFVDLEKFNSAKIKLELLNTQLIIKYQVLPIGQNNNNQLLLAVSDPTDYLALNAIRFHSSKEVKPLIAEYDKLQGLISELLKKWEYAAFNISSIEKKTSIQETQDDSIVKFVDQVLRDAINQGASDVHFEPYTTTYRIRFRIDGILYEITKPDVDVAKRLSARLKVMAELDIAEKRLPQDGRFTLNLNKTTKRDCRVSTCPTIAGEKIAIRILSPPDLTLTIDKLGFNKQQQKLFLEYIRAAQGMILITGPTGSGKTITLYTALNLLNVTKHNISTVEDPVEVNLSGINQVEVNHKTGLSFAKTLRAFLRQDPDIIMVGEIRDLETAQIAIRAAQTGHLVLSTLHTNTACESITRLLNMGIANFNLAASINLFIAQRLLRKLCPKCKKPQNIPEPALKAQGLNITTQDTVIYQATGCKQCKNGYKGRVGVFELLPISKEISNMIMQRGTVMEIEQRARCFGMQSLREVALQKVIAGVTSLEEVNRVLGIN